MKHSNKTSNSTINVNILPSDSAIDLPEIPDMPGTRERYENGDKIFEEHAHNIQSHKKSDSLMQRRVCLSTATSMHSQPDDETEFAAKVEEMQKTQVLPSAPIIAPKAIEVRKRRHTRSKSTSRLHEQNLKAEHDAELQSMPTDRLPFLDSLRPTHRLKSMRSLNVIKFNPHESLDFRCVGEGFLSRNLDEETEIEEGRGELLRSINITRLRMDTRAIQILKRSEYLDREAKVFANELDVTSLIPPGSSITIDEETALARLVGPPGQSAFATGERWATYQHKRHIILRPSKHQKSDDCEYRNYNMFAAISDESYNYIGISRSQVDRRWVVLLSGHTGGKPQYPLTRSPSASSRKSQIVKSRNRSITIGTVTSFASDEDYEHLPPLPVMGIPPLPDPSAVSVWI
jgi:hypothetical protein